MKHVFQCEDGTIHDNYETATAHEGACFDRWLSEKPVMELESIWLELDRDGEDEFYGSPRDYGQVFLEKAYEMSIADPSLVIFKGGNHARVQKRP